MEQKPQVPTQENILNEWDRNILREGTKNVVEQILVKFEGEVPDVVILPETSARPLFYLLDPIFKKIVSDKILTLPKYIFFNIDSADDDTEQSELDYSKGSNVYDGKQSSAQEVENRFGATKIEEARETQQKRVVEKERANEIKKYINQLHLDNPKVVVIDDFGMEGLRGGGQREMAHAFGNAFPYYYIFSSNLSGGGVQSGVEVNLFDDSQLNPSTGRRTRLSFAGGEKKKSIGVKKNKDSKYVSLLRNRDGFSPKDQARIGQLRKEMRELGEEIAKEI